MTDNLEQRLTTEFRDSAYELPVDVEEMAGIVRRRRARRSASAVGASVAGVAVLTAAGIVTVANLSGSDPDQVTPDRPAISGPKQTGGAEVRLADVVVRGLPAGTRPAPDPEAALAVAPVLRAQPTSGERTVLAVDPAVRGVTRVVVVVGYEAPVGLPGTPDEYQWLGRLQGAKGLATDDDGTAYFTASTPAGRKWFVAVTGPDAAGRLAALEAIATASVPGT